MNFANQIIQGNQFNSIEHTLFDNIEVYHLLAIKKNKKELVVVNEITYKAINEIPITSCKGRPTVLIINNNHVLTKELLGNHEPDKIFQTAFANMNPNEFYYKIYQTKEKMFISICRKLVVTNLLEEYHKKGINIIDFSLGNLSVAQLIPHYNQSELLTSNAKVSIANNEVLSINNQEYFEGIHLNINGIQLSNMSTNGFATILAYYTNNNNLQSNYADESKKLNYAFKQIKIFQVVFRMALVLFFLVLMGNFLFYSSYEKKIELLQNEITLNNTYKTKAQSLENIVKKKRKVVHEINQTESSKVSYYVDQLGASIPNTLLLKRIQFQPLLKTIKEKKEVLMERNIILIEGDSYNGANFSKWFEQMEALPWVENITVIKYGTGKKNTTTFYLKLTLSDD